MAAARIARNSATHAARVLVTTATVVVITPIAIATLGIDGFGLWAIAMAAHAWLLFLDLGAGTTAMTAVAEARATGDAATERAVIARLSRVVTLTALIAGGALALFAEPIASVFSADPALADMLRVVGLAAPVLAPLTLANQVLLGRGRHGTANAIAVAGRTLQFGAAIAVLAATADPFVFVVVSLAGPLLTGAGHAVVMLRGLPSRSPGQPRPAPPTRRQGSFFGINIAVAINTQADTLVVGAVAGPAAAGLYRVAERVTGHLGLFLKQIAHTLVPEIAGAAKTGDRRALRHLLIAGSRWTLLLGMPPLVVLATFGDALLGAWIGPVGAAAGPLATMIWAALLISLVQAQAVNILALTGSHRRVAAIFLATALANLGTSIALGSAFGLWGVVAATLITVSAVDLLWLIPAGARRLDLSIGQTLRRIAVRPLAVALPTALAGFAIRVAMPNPALPALVGIVLALVSLTFVLTLAVGLDARERSLVRGLVARIVPRRLRSRSVPGRPVGDLT
jgi:O-antigen/teichoic acid export membrane protein